MSKEYKEYVKRCNELGVEPLSEFTPVRVNRGVITGVLIAVAVIVNILASVLSALMKPSGAGKR